MPTCKAIWTDGVRYLHTSETGHALVTDAPETVGGGNSAPTPMELVLHALAGCTGVDLALILDKMRQPYTALEITVTGERADSHPKVYTAVHLHVTARGEISPKKLERALKLSVEDFCSVAAMLRSTATLTYTGEVQGEQS